MAETHEWLIVFDGSSRSSVGFGCFVPGKLEFVPFSRTAPQINVWSRLCPDGAFGFTNPSESFTKRDD